MIRICFVIRTNHFIRSQWRSFKTLCISHTQTLLSVPRVTRWENIRISLETSTSFFVFFTKPLSEIFWIRSFWSYCLVSVLCPFWLKIPRFVTGPIWSVASLHNNGQLPPLQLDEFFLKLYSARHNLTSEISLDVDTSTAWCIIDFVERHLVRLNLL